jgi:hypothetical protein
MSKPYYEIAAEITQDLIKARGNAISGIDNAGTQSNLMNQFLSDAAVASAYKAVLNAVSTK